MFIFEENQQKTMIFPDDFEFQFEGVFLFVLPGGDLDNLPSGSWTGLRHGFVVPLDQVLGKLDFETTINYDISAGFCFSCDFFIS